jgi:hypothetical protein
MSFSIHRRVLRWYGPNALASKNSLRKDGTTRTCLLLAIAASVALAALALVSPASATCYGDTCDDDPVTELEQGFGIPGAVLTLPAGRVDSDWVSFDERGAPNGVGLGGWSTTTHVQVSWKGFFLMNVPSREPSSFMPLSGLRFTVRLPVYPLEGPVCVDAIDYPGGPPVKRLGCVSSFTWWV